MNKKNAQLSVNLEESLYLALSKLAGKEGMSISGYARRLILKDLRERGVLPDELLTSILAGGRSATVI